MRIAQIAPLTDGMTFPREALAQQLIGDLTEALTERGHEVVLFPSPDLLSRHGIGCTSARRHYASRVFWHEKAFFSDQTFDIIHSHLDTFALPFAHRCPLPVLTTVHEAFDSRETAYLYEHVYDLPLISPCASIRDVAPGANWLATIYTGLPEKAFAFRPQIGEYLGILDQISWKTLPLHALTCACKTGIPIRIAGRMDAAGEEYFAMLKRTLQGSRIEYIGEISDAEEQELLGKALALFVPAEETSLPNVAMVKALACGTPIVSAASKLHAQFIEPGITGFVCQSHETMVEAITRVPSLDRQHCRDAFQANFTRERMVDEYIAAYEAIRDTRWSKAYR